VPGTRPDRFAKAAASGADAVILDLEDAVSALDKASARTVVARHVFAHRALVRVNGAGTPWHGDDLAALAGASRPAGIILPKTESPDHVAAVATVLGPRISVFALLETARGVRDGGLIPQAPWTANTIVVAGQTAARTTSIACLSNCVARSSPEWTMWLCMDRRAASASRARRFSSIAE
jgi:citrate lyase subunit beta/citryl-CoA lyase